MKVIGITGGVGCGKSAVLEFLQEETGCSTLMADEAAALLEAPGGECYEPMCRLLEDARREGDGVLLPGGPGTPFDRREAAARMYRSGELRAAVNALVHPAVVRYIKEAIRREREADAEEFFFLEAALLLENGFLQLVDEMWYIYCPEPVRRERLRRSRGYSDSRISAMMAAQLPESEFRERCQFTLDNGGSPEYMRRQARERLRQLRKGTE